MRLPRDIEGAELAKRLETFGYRVVRRQGSHIRLRTEQNGEHNLTLVADRLKLGTLNRISTDVARHFQLTKDEVVRRLFE